MTTSGRSSFRRTSLVVLALGALTISACSSDDEPMASVPDSTMILATDAPADSTAPETGELPEDVTAAGVVLAATLIATGNIDDAVASGLVSPAEVDEARAAIENGTLDRWVQLAEGN
ncbi:MAG: hypothetical protein ACKOI2_13530 [Actinomycetota bacterium]